MKSKHLRRTRKTKRNKRTKTKRNKKHQRKIYIMKGCSHKCNCDCHKRRGGSSPIGGLPIKGGNGPPIPSPLVGSEYKIGEGGNYYGPEYKSTGFDIPRQLRLNGGGILPTNLTNVGRNMVNEVQTIYNGVLGYERPPSDNAWEGQGMRI